MIIYGTKGTLLATTSLFEPCTACKTGNSVQLYLYQNHAHIFWIPTFPIGKTAASYCNHCQLSFRKKEFSPSLKEQYQHLSNNHRTPLWTFSGLAVLAILITVGILYNKHNDQNNAKLILDPKKNDLYEIELDDQRYTLYKVERIAADTVYLIPNQYETNKMSGLSGLIGKGEENFIHASFPVMKIELKNMLEDGTILDIERD